MVRETPAGGGDEERGGEGKGATHPTLNTEPNLNSPGSCWGTWSGSPPPPASSWLRGRTHTRTHTNCQRQSYGFWTGFRFRSPRPPQVSLPKLFRCLKGLFSCCWVLSNGGMLCVSMSVYSGSSSRRKFGPAVAGVK